MKKKLLIIYATYGNGHKSVAKYLYSYFSTHGNYEILLLDILDYSNFFGKMSIKVFNYNLQHRMPVLFDLSYSVTNTKAISRLAPKYNIKAFDNNKIRNIIHGFNPDVTISTHSAGSNLLSHYNDEGITKTKIITVITDYKSHQFWISNHKKEDAFIVSDEVVKKDLIEKGVPKNKIYPFGIPINVDTNNNIPLDVIKKSYNIKNNLPIFLFFGGSAVGSSSYIEYFKKVAKENFPVQIIFICGNNENFKNSCLRFIEHKNIKNIKLIGYSTDIPNLLRISDLVITKAGATILTECIRIKKPMLIIPGYGGQEKHNERYVVKKKYAVGVKTPMGLRKEIKKLLDNPNIILKMKEKLEQNKKIDSNKKIYELVEKLIKKEM